ncbi:MAG TPA: RNA-binding protein [Hyphomonadaceae bacterium]|jgi:ribosome-associated heat shock protein Hsp15|nr:RNA-binding protein [Hyphomonadaceae bacterium]
MSGPHEKEEQDDDTRMRLDVFLWRARFFKARTSASEAIEASGARIERDGQIRRVDKPASPVEAGDILSFACPAGIRLIRILLLPQRRGPPAEAALCYEAVEAGTLKS